MSSIAFINANVIPMERGERHSAVLIQDGKITALGADGEIAAAAKAAGIAQKDAKGATILPAFFDCHVHALTTGENALGVDLFDCKSIAGVLGALKEAEQNLPEGQWVFGKRLDESRLAEGRPPVMKELDAIARPVFIADRGKHYVQVNTAAFEALALPANTAGIRLGEDGKPNGRLQDAANRLASEGFFGAWSIEQRQDAVRYTANQAVSKGITTINAMEGLDSGDDDIPIIRSVAPELPVDMKIFWCTPDAQKAVDMGFDVWGGDILLDGSIGSRTAAFSKKYCDGDTAGYLNYPDDQVEAWVNEALRRDLALSFHCIGELGVTQALDAMEKALAAHPEKASSHRLRLEHFGFPTQADIDRCAKMGIRVSTQPSFTFLRGGPGTVYRSRLGEKRERGGYPSRRMLDAGIVLGGGSDSDVTPMDALLGIHAAVNQPYPENAVTPYEAVRMYTLDAAKTSFMEDQKGSLAPGKQGDLVILAEDPMAADPRTIKDIKVLATVHKGKVVYEG